MRLKQLRQRRADPMAEAAGRALSDDEKKRGDTIAAELAEVSDELARLERQQERIGGLGAVPSIGTTRVGVGSGRVVLRDSLAYPGLGAARGLGGALGCGLGAAIDVGWRRSI